MSNRLFYAAAWLLAAWLAPAGAADYPTKPVRLIVPFPPGGGNDLLGRPVAQKLTVLRISSPPISARTLSSGPR